MDISQNSPEQGQPSPDPRLQPTPDYGKLGPGSDVIFGPPTAGAIPGRPSDSIHIGQIMAVIAGVLAAVLVGSVGSARAGWKDFQGFFSIHSASNSPVRLSTANPRQLDHMKPQDQAETLLELAVSDSPGAVDEIFIRADRWRGKLQWDSQFSSIATAAHNSRDLRVREAGIEAELAAYGLVKNPWQIDSLISQVDSDEHAQKIWALWSLGLLANRGIETDRAVEILTSHLKDASEDSRRWSVEGLALVGTTPTITTLLKTMHDDPSPSVRERAACSLAESGMLTREQRLTAVPQLLNFTDDPALDAQTHAWAFQALGDITRQRLPNDSAAWRNWYSATLADASSN